MNRVAVAALVVCALALCALAVRQVLAQTQPPPAANFESVVGFDVAVQGENDVYFCVLMRDVMGKMRVDVYDGSGIQRGQIALRTAEEAESPIRPE